MPSNEAARDATRRTVCARRISTPNGWYAWYGRAARIDAGGVSRSPSSAGPGAGSPCWRTSPCHARRASKPVTFCSRMAGTSASMTASVRAIRTPG